MHIGGEKKNERRKSAHATVSYENPILSYIVIPTDTESRAVHYHYLRDGDLVCGHSTKDLMQSES